VLGKDIVHLLIQKARDVKRAVIASDEPLKIVD